MPATFYNTKPVGDTLYSVFGFSDIGNPLAPVPLDSAGVTFSVVKLVSNKWIAVQNVSIGPTITAMVNDIDHPDKDQMSFYTVTILGETNPTASKRRSRYRVKISDDDGTSTTFEHVVLDT
jgi:hypothetical protein